MSAIFSRTYRSLERLLRHLARRGAISTLRELDDDALKDIGLARSEIEAAAFGRMTAYGRARKS
ncbi:protein of unknown function (DUF1127) [Rhizobium leguminosarum bv. trifolii WSM597]|uniref:YjiS-like domain-containing protein n=3 Tax=Rhizobium leguminosarum TaxID=384 RepID=A0ABF7QVA7_RHILW|nr:DUF1127 domain-containing protein [Rhizobium leguminosarum]ACI58383.1 protein of unknown function DUF1127 [Rhizobium leguminosarum bv. trifolii WSM2304]EJB06050.1 protein of unknown function (DUF1127) [Rhizobium leguminosarum bv. trifolii WSM597]MBB6219345.1 uncharacterized protein YjiS (DUF1127 family) [Rhizobium leguminosarum]